MQHVEILRQGTDVWNQWRRENPNVRPNLFDAELAWANLAGANLYLANLARANLAGTRLCWNSRELLGEVLWRAATTEPQRMLAAYILRRRGWCWDDWTRWEPPSPELHKARRWAIRTLAARVQDDDEDLPSLIRRRILTG